MDNWQFVGALSNIYCTATGSNTVVLTPAATSPAVTAYQNGMKFTWVQSNTSTTGATIQVGSLAALPGYAGTGVLLTAGQLLGGTYYEAVFDQTLGGGAGGFRVGAGSSVVSFGGSSTISDIPIFNNTTATQLIDSGIALNTGPRVAFGGPANLGIIGNPVLVTGHQVAPLDQNMIWTGNNIFFQTFLGSTPYCRGSICTITNTIGTTYALKFTSAHLAGSPITISVPSSATVNTIAAALATGINAVPALNNGLGLPLFGLAQGQGGLLNIQWDNTALPDLALADVSTGGGVITVPAPIRTLDVAEFGIGRYISPSFVGQAGDVPIVNIFYGQDAGGALVGMVLMQPTMIDATAGHITSSFLISTAQNEAAFPIITMGGGSGSCGIALYDQSGNLATGGQRAAGSINAPLTGGFFQAGVSYGIVNLLARAVNFNSGNTDTTFAIPVPTGYTRYRVQYAAIDGASQTLTTATCGLFTAAGGGGTAIVTSGTAVTINTAAEATNNNTQFFTINNQNTQSFNGASLFFRVQTPEGAAATADVIIGILFLS